MYIAKVWVTGQSTRTKHCITMQQAIEFVKNANETGKLWSVYKDISEEILTLMEDSKDDSKSEVHEDSRTRYVQSSRKFEFEP